MPAEGGALEGEQATSQGTAQAPVCSSVQGMDDLLVALGYTCSISNHVALAAAWRAETQGCS